MVQNIPNNIPTKQYMTSEQFCFWLQGLFELCPDLKKLSPAQVQMIREHLDYVFKGKETVSFTYTPTPGISTITYPQGVGGSSGLGGLLSSDPSLFTSVVC